MIILLALLFTAFSVNMAAANEVGAGVKQCEVSGMVYEVSLGASTEGALAAKPVPTGEMSAEAKERGICVVRYCLPGRVSYGPRECAEEFFGSGAEDETFTTIGERLVERELDRIGEIRFSKRFRDDMLPMHPAFAEQLYEHFSNKAAVAERALADMQRSDWGETGIFEDPQLVADDVYRDTRNAAGAQMRSYAEIASWVREKLTIPADSPLETFEVSAGEHVDDGNGRLGAFAERLGRLQLPEVGPDSELPVSTFTEERLAETYALLYGRTSQDTFADDMRRLERAREEVRSNPAARGVAYALLSVRSAADYLYGASQSALRLFGW